MTLLPGERRRVDVTGRAFHVVSASANFQLELNEDAPVKWESGLGGEDFPIEFTHFYVTAGASGLNVHIVTSIGKLKDTRLSLAGGLNVNSMPPITTDGPLQVTGPRGKIQGQKHVVGTTPVLIANASDLFEKTRVYAGMLDLYISGDFNDFGHGDAAFVPAGGSMEFGAGSIVWAVRLSGSAECREVVHYR